MADNRTNFPRITSTRLQSLVTELEKNKELLSGAYCLSEGLSAWQKVVEVVNTKNMAAKKDVHFLIKSWNYQKSKVMAMMQTNSVEKDLDINKRIIRLIQIEESDHNQQSCSQSLVGNVIDNKDPSMSQGSNSFTLAKVGFDKPQSVFLQKNMDRPLEKNVNNGDFNSQDALESLAATNIQILECLQTKIDKSLQELRDISGNLNKNMETLNTNVKALGGFLFKVIEAQHAVDLSLSMRFESVAAALQSRKMNNNIDNNGH